MVEAPAGVSVTPASGDLEELGGAPVRVRVDAEVRARARIRTHTRMHAITHTRAHICHVARMRALLQDGAGGAVTVGASVYFCADGGACYHREALATAEVAAGGAASAGATYAPRAGR